MTDLPLLEVTEADLVFLQDEWRSLLNRHRVRPEKASDLFSSLTASYSGRDRFYHNLHHVAEVLRLIHSLKDRLQNYDAVSFAAWFHDAIYDTKRNDNEEQSAALAAQTLSIVAVPPETISIVRNLILATKKHEVDTFALNAGALYDASLLLDCDLSILGAPNNIYRQYCEAIRQEYSWVPDLDFKRGRKKVLQTFMARVSIYFTAEMRDRFEAQARRNVDGEIQSL